MPDIQCNRNEWNKGVNSKTDWKQCKETYRKRNEILPHFRLSVTFFRSFQPWAKYKDTRAAINRVHKVTLPIPSYVHQYECFGPTWKRWSYFRSGQTNREKYHKSEKGLYLVCTRRQKAWSTLYGFLELELSSELNTGYSFTLWKTPSTY